MNFKPLHDLIVLDMDPPEQSTNSLIHVPEHMLPKTTRGVAVAVGPGKRDHINGALIPTTVAVGNRVIVGAGSGSEVEIEGKKFLIVREDDIMVVLQ